MMENNQYELVANHIYGIGSEIITKTGLDEDTALEKFYSSASYSELERNQSMALQRPKAVSCLGIQTLKNGVNILNIRCRQKAD